MKNKHYLLAAAGVTAAAAATAAVWAARRRAPQPHRLVTVEAPDGDPILAVTGQPVETADPLHGTTHLFNDEEARCIRCAARMGRGGKATSPEREQMNPEFLDTHVSRSGPMLA